VVGKPQYKDSHNHRPTPLKGSQTLPRATRMGGKAGNQ
jgi:hypothetical protein